MAPVSRPRREPPAIRTTLRLLPGAGRRRTALLGTGIAVTAALPATFAIAGGALVTAVGEAAGRGFDSPAGHRVLLWGAAAAMLFGAQQVSPPALRALAEALGRRLDAQLETRVMAAALAPAGVAHIEDPDVLDQLSTARAVGVGDVTCKEAVAGMAAAAVRFLGGLGAAVVLAGYVWWLAAGLLAVYITLTRVLTSDLRRTIGTLRGNVRRFRRASYFRELALTAPAAKELRIFGLNDWVKERYRERWSEGMGAFRRDRRHGVLIPPVAAAVLLIVQGGTYALLGRSAARGDITIGQLTMYAGAAVGVAGIFRIGIEDLNIRYGTASVPAVMTVQRMVTEPRFDLLGSRAADDLPAESIRFENVSFRYPGREADVFSDLNLEIPAGRSLAIVGHNGAGKTTLVKLLVRLQDPTGGRIVADGIDLTDIDPRSWRRRVAAIFQDFTRYQLSIADNVTFGALEHAQDAAALARAADRAGLTELLERLPDGWDSVLAPDTPDGTDLSGGQWQRVALARALFSLEAGAGILVLDEPTAALDVRAEAAFYDRFLELTAGITTIVISHRFSTVRRADRIVVIDHGRVVEQGAHDTLMRMGGRYARMFRLQAEQFAEPVAGTGGARTDA